VLVSQKIDLDIPQIIVSDTLKALGQLGAWKRQTYLIPALAVTGSSGKTTTRTLLASIMQHYGRTLTSIKSFNNDIGVPLTLWSLNSSHEFMVLEIGANHPGEISYLMNLVRPLSCALITNVAPCHLEGFISMDGIAKAKAEIFEGLAIDGKVILNADDNYYDYWLSLIGNKHKITTFGLKNTADVSAKNIILNENFNPDFVLALPNEEIHIKLPLFGEHNVMNALAAAAAAYAFGVDVSSIKNGLEKASTINKRLIPAIGYKGAAIIDDTYNANPFSTEAALRYLSIQPGEKIFAFGGMGELGVEEEKWHSIVGEAAKKFKIDKLFVCGKLRNAVAKSFGENALVFESQDDLIKTLKSYLDKDKTVLVKGSRSTKMENVVSALLNENAN